jgi:heptaprenyl diphosphate synthase
LVQAYATTANLGRRGAAHGDDRRVELFVISAVPVDFSDPALAADIADGLVGVEKVLAEAAVTEEALLTEASRHLIDAGGKRFRATLVLLAAHFGDSRDERIVPAAAAIELTHLATLFHDDVMDEASIRRGLQSANSRWSNTIAILTGDFLFARASSILAELGAEAIRIQAETFTRLVSGQVAETLGPRPGQDPLVHYLRVVEDKTASLIATAGRFGAMFAGAPADVVARITAASHALGVAFQLSDDILDVASESAQSGKAPGTDLREGVRSLPVLHALAPAAPGSPAAGPGVGAGPGSSPAGPAVGGRAEAGDARLRELLSRDGLTDDAEHAEALALLRAHPAMDAARADLRRWSDAARTEIAGLPDVPARRAFEIMCDFVMERTS